VAGLDWGWWLVGGLVLVGVEALLPSFVAIWFGVAALAVAGLALAAPGLDLRWQLGLFAVLSLLCLAAAWTLRRRKAGPADAASRLNDRAAQQVGRMVVLAEPILGGRGHAFVGDTLWSLEGPDLPSGSRVRIVGGQGQVLRVEPAETPPGH